MAYTFISGATGGIGRAFALLAAKKGYPIFITGRSQGKISALKAEILSQYSVDVISFVCDLSSERSRTKMLAFIDENAVTFDRIINVAGIDTQKPFLDYTDEKILKQLRVNCEATVDLTYKLLKRREKTVEVIAISSMSGETPMPYFALYSATKAMLTSLFTSLHYELKNQGVKVTVVIPGGVYTRPDIVEQIKGQGLWGKLTAKTPEYIAEKSLVAVRKNKMRYVPGFWNRFLSNIIKIAPRRLVLRYVARRWKTQSKDAF